MMYDVLLLVGPPQLPTPTASNRGRPEAFPFSYCQAFLLLCLPLSLCQKQVMVADSLPCYIASCEYIVFTYSHWVAFIYFHKGKQNSSFLKSGLCKVTSILSTVFEWCREELYSVEPDKHYPSKWSRSTSTVISQGISLYTWYGILPVQSSSPNP